MKRGLLLKDAQIISWVQEIRSCVAQLDKDHEQLIYTVLVRKWIKTYKICNILLDLKAVNTIIVVRVI